MVETKKLILKLKKNKLLFFMYIPVASVFFIIGFMLLSRPDIAGKGVKDGLSICFDTLIPSLFPVMLFFSILFDSGVLDIIAKKTDKAMNTVFRLPGIALPIIIMSFTGGFPIGATLIKRAYENKRITANQGQRLMLFCINPGPAFTVSTVGCFMLGSEKAGWLIYASILASSLITGIFIRFLDDGEHTIICRENKENMSFSGDISATVEAVINSMLSICAWVTVFSCINSLIDSLHFNVEFVNILKMALEVTNAALISCQNYTLPVTSAVTAFAGFCIHLQIMPSLVTVHLKYRRFIASRIVSAVISFLTVRLAVSIFPEYVQVVSLGNKPESAAFNASLPVALCMMILCGLFILGDNYVINKKLKKYTPEADNETSLY